MSLFSFIYVGAGAALGGMARFSVNRLFIASSFPYATLAVNCLGCFLAGLLMTWFSRSAEGMDPADPRILFCVVGALGGFTTFSAFGWESIQLLQNGDRTAFLINLIANLFGSLLSVVAGIILARGISTG